jgi:hypothetical protein
LFDREISVQVTGNGPCAGSHIVRLNESNDAVIVFRSAEEEFPKECLDEVRNERNEDSPPLRGQVLTKRFPGLQMGRIL